MRLDSRNFGAVLMVLAAIGLDARTASGQLFGSNPQPPPAQDSGIVPPDVLTIPQLPVPPNVKFMIDDTVIVGGDQDWTGQVILVAPYSVIQMTQFFRSEMPAMGWTETAIVRARRTSISFIRDKRVATVRITQKDSGKSTEVDVVVSPNFARFNTPGQEAPGHPSN